MPGAAKAWLTLGPVAVPPSPKLHDAAAPSGLQTSSAPKVNGSVAPTVPEAGPVKPVTTGPAASKPAARRAEVLTSSSRHAATALPAGSTATAGPTSAVAPEASSRAAGKVADGPADAGRTVAWMEAPAPCSHTIAASPAALTLSWGLATASPLTSTFCGAPQPAHGSSAAREAAWIVAGLDVCRHTATASPSRVHGHLRLVDVLARHRDHLRGGPGLRDREVAAGAGARDALDGVRDVAEHHHRRAPGVHRQLRLGRASR